MALSDCQYSIRELVMGEGTEWEVLTPGTDLFNLNNRADQAGNRAWGDGGYSGAEWQEERTIPIRVKGTSASRDMSGFIGLVNDFNEAFAPVQDGINMAEFRFHLGGREYLYFVRPRMSEPDSIDAAFGVMRANGGLVALDPIRYSGELVTVSLALPQFTGGVSLPLHLPMYLGTKVGGEAEITNEGKTNTGLNIRIDGPVKNARISLRRSDGIVQTINIDFDVGLGQFVLINTAAPKVLFDGVSNRRNQVTGDFPILPKGTSTLSWIADNFSEIANMTVSWRHAWR